MDINTDEIFGISTNKAYQQLLKGKIGIPVVVAVIDGGVDIEHPALKSSIWTNVKEIANNGKDDDNNGYVDDLHGWNFLGSSKGSFYFDNKELVRSLRSELKKDPNSAKAIDLKNQLEDKRTILRKGLQIKENERTLLNSIIKVMGKQYPTIEEFKQYRYKTQAEEKVLVKVVKGLISDPDYRSELEKYYYLYKNQYEYLFNIDYNPRSNNSEYKEKIYGNSDVTGSEPSHGTHIAGVIAARPNYEKGIKGIAMEAQIMSIRSIPNGDVLDKDLASSIHYAVDNGAKVINISESKAISPDRALVDLAVQYAMQKDVLIIHAAGNESKLLDTASAFPSRYYINGKVAKNWIEVGASNSKNDHNLMAWFSNYGKTTVDVFAPGVDIYSTYPKGEYAYESGTSMAAPVVSGLAALIRSYYPNLNALQVKKVILDSVVKVNHKVKNNAGELIDFSITCRSGGIVNAFNALELADKIN